MQVAAAFRELSEGGDGGSGPAEASAIESAPAVTEKSILEVTVAVQPSELFAGNTGEVLDLGCTDNYAVIYRKTADGYEYAVYNEAGQVITPTTNAFPRFALTPHELGRAIKQAGRSGVMPHSNSPSYVKVSEACQLTGFPQDRVDELAAGLKRVFPSSTAIHISTMEGNREGLLSRPSDIRSDSARDKIVFVRGNAVTIYLTRDQTGKVLHPEDWECVDIKDNRKITTEQLQERPYLREFLDTQKGRLIGSTDLAVDTDRGILNVIDTKKNVRVYSDSAVGYALDPSDQKTIYYYNPQSGELKTFDATTASLTQTPVIATKLPFPGTVKDFKLDPQGNFILMIVEDGGKSKLHVLEKDTLSIAASIPDIIGPIECDNLGNIYFVDSAKHLRLAQTNFMTFPKGGIEGMRTARRDELLRLSESIESLQLPDDAEATLADIPEDQLDEARIKRELSRQINERFSAMVEQASTLEGLDSLQRRIARLSEGPEFKAHPDIFEGIHQQIEGRERDLKLAELTKAMQAFKRSVEGAERVAEVLALDPELAELGRLRREVVIKDPLVRKGIDEQLRSFEKQKSDKYAQYSGQVNSLLEEKFEAVRELVGQTGTADELSDLIADPAVQEFEALVASVRDRNVSGTWKAKYRDLMIAQRQTLVEREREAREEEMLHQAELLEDAREIFGEIKKALAEVPDPDALQKWQSRNPLITAFRAKLLALPSDLREAEETTLSDALRDKRQELERRVVLSLPKEGGVVKFGEHEFPIFQSPRVVWQPKVVPSSPGSATGTLVFRDSAGRAFTPETGPLPTNMNDALTKDAIAQHRAAAEKYFETRVRKVPSFDSTWVLNDYNRETLGKMAKLAGIQLERKRGILILEGEAGVGKNVNVDMFAHFTNRESFTFSCNFQSEKEDLTYAFKYDPARGSYQVDSKLLEMLQTPGAIIVLDEINTLPPGVLKMLNPLLDYRRTLYLPDGREIKADPSVVVVGTMNPQHYLGVKPLSPEVKSRARIMYLDYPPEKVGARLAPYEGEILAKFVPALASVAQSEFMLMWDSVVNRDQGNGADKFLTKDREAALKNISHIVRTANKVREAYRAYRTGASNDPIDFVFSLRETIDIAAEMGAGGKIRDAIEEVIIPKISDPAEKERVKAIVRSV